MYLYKVLARDKDHWTMKMLNHLQVTNLGWARNIREKLENYQLETDWKLIRKKSKIEWNRQIEEAIDRKNREKNNTKLHHNSTKWRKSNDQDKTHPQKTHHYTTIHSKTS